MRILAAGMRRDDPQNVEARGLPKRRKELGSSVGIHPSMFAEMLIRSSAKC